MSGAEGVQIPLNVVINRQQDRVLLAEADTNFVDVLVSFLTLPLGKILGLFKSHYGDSAPVIGSLNALYTSLENLDDAYFCSSEGKQMLLNPRSTFSDDCRGLKLNLDDSQPTSYFICVGTDCAKPQYYPNRNGVSDRGIRIYTGEGKCRCGNSLKRLETRSAGHPLTMLCGEVLMKRDAYNFTISDDMQLRCIASGSILESLRSFGITDTNGVKQRTLQLRQNEMMDLLKVLLLSQTPLTDLVLNEQQMMTKLDLDSLLNHVDQPKEANSKTVVLKAMLQKSTGKFLFAQAEDDFVDFLFSLFTIPLGGVAYLLNGSTNLAGLDNLYKSISSIDSVFFKQNDIKTQLVRPMLPFMYLSERQILPISEKSSQLYYHKKVTGDEYVDLSSEWLFQITIPCLPEDPKGGNCYLKRLGMFMVMDDLTVTPLSALSTLSLFDVQDISLSDVDEVEVKIGVEEGLRIMKASLTSTAVITDALITPLLIKKTPNKNPWSE